MFYKYILPLIICLLFAIIYRKNVEFEYGYNKWRKVPRVLMFIFILLGCCPIINWFVAVFEIILFIIILCSDGSDFARIRELKNNKINRWLFKD